MGELLLRLFETNVIWIGVWETVWMTFLSTALAYVIGLPVGILLRVTDADGLMPVVWLNKLVGITVNVLRSFPFVILMVAFLPLARAIVGTGLGNGAMTVMLVVAAAPYVARMTESSLKEVDPGVVEAARSMGANPLQIILKVYLPEAKPSLIVGAVISTVTVLGYSAMAGTIGGGGLGQIAITYGYQRYQQDVIWVCVAFTVVIVQIIQEFGMYLSRKTDKRLTAKKSKFKSKIKKETTL